MSIPFRAWPSARCPGSAAPLTRRIPDREESAEGIADEHDRSLRAVVCDHLRDQSIALTYPASCGRVGGPKPGTSTASADWPAWANRCSTCRHDRRGCRTRASAVVGPSPSTDYSRVTTPTWTGRRSLITRSDLLCPLRVGWQLVDNLAVGLDGSTDAALEVAATFGGTLPMSGIHGRQVRATGAIVEPVTISRLQGTTPSNTCSCPAVGHGGQTGAGDRHDAGHPDADVQISKATSVTPRYLLWRRRSWPSRVCHDVPTPNSVMTAAFTGLPALDCSFQ